MDFDVLFLCSYIFQVCDILRSCNMDFNVVFVSLFIFFQVCDVFPWILSSTFSERVGTNTSLTASTGLNDLIS